MNQEEQNKLENERTRGNEADQILNAKVFIEAWAEAEKAIYAQRRKCGVKDTELAMKLIMAEQTLGIVKDYITNVMKTGKFGEAQLKLEQDRVSWLKRMSSSGFSRA